jgi:hypothetical protein
MKLVFLGSRRFWRVDVGLPFDRLKMWRLFWDQGAGFAALLQIWRDNQS